MYRNTYDGVKTLVIRMWRSIHLKNSMHVTLEPCFLQNLIMCCQVCVGGNRVAVCIRFTVFSAVDELISLLDSSVVSAQSCGHLAQSLPVQMCPCVSSCASGRDKHSSRLDCPPCTWCGHDLSWREFIFILFLGSDLTLTNNNYQISLLTRIEVITLLPCEAASRFADRKWFSTDAADSQTILLQESETRLCI